MVLTERYLRELYRQPAVIFITPTQPVIWLLLFGALFKNVAKLPGFGGGNYATYLTPGVVIMTAMFSSSWTGMAYIEDMQTGVMDRFLTAPVSRGALTAAMLAYQAVTSVVQSAIIIAMGWGIGAAFPGGAAGIAALIGVRGADRGGHGGAVDRLRAADPAARGADRRLDHAGDAADLPFRRVPVAAPSSRAGSRPCARFNPVNWAASAGRAAVGSHPAWATVGSYAGFLALALAFTAVAATQLSAPTSGPSDTATRRPADAPPHVRAAGPLTSGRSRRRESATQHD